MNLTPWQHPLQMRSKKYLRRGIDKCSTGIIGTLLSSQRTHAHPHQTLPRPATGASFHRTTLIFKLFFGSYLHRNQPEVDTCEVLTADHPLYHNRGSLVRDPVAPVPWSLSAFRARSALTRRKLRGSKREVKSGGGRSVYLGKQVSHRKSVECIPPRR